MENHPIPQNVTGFKFRLIGDMTVKQFAYLASGAFFAWFCYILPLPIFVKLPFSIFFGFLGIALAFIPIDGRPLDIMISYYIRALFVSDRYIFQKRGGYLTHVPAVQKQLPAPKTETQSSDKLEAYLRALSRVQKNKLDEKEDAFLLNITTISKQPSIQETPPPSATFQQPAPAFARILIQEEAAPKPQAQAPQPTINTPAEEEQAETETKTEQIDQQTNNKMSALQQELENTKAQLSQLTSAPSLSDEAHKKLLELEHQLAEVLLQKDQLQNQLVSLHKKLITEEPASTGNLQPQQQKQRIANLPMPSAPNQITGLVTDARGNVLPNILVEVKDQQGNPVRAFKTNPLGQFASATPLAAGVYYVSFEDPSSTHSFPTVMVTTTNELIEPLEVVSEDEREKLRKALFN